MYEYDAIALHIIDVLDGKVALKNFENTSMKNRSKETSDAMTSARNKKIRAEKLVKTFIVNKLIKHLGIPKHLTKPWCPDNWMDVCGTSS
jgi:hypothetical protein